jgi:hypothetical protein
VRPTNAPAHAALSTFDAQIFRVDPTARAFDATNSRAYGQGFDTASVRPRRPRPRFARSPAGKVLKESRVILRLELEPVVSDERRTD